MADGNDQEKTEEPTPKRAEDFREQGKIAQSRELTSVAVLFGAFLSLYMLLRQLMTALMEMLRLSFRSLRLDFDVGSLTHLVAQMAQLVLWPLAPLFGAVMVLGLLAQVAQVGWKVSSKPLEPKLEKLNPMNGLKRIFSSKGLVELAKGVFKLVIVATVLYVLLRDELRSLLMVAREGTRPTLDHLGHLSWLFISRALLFLGALALLDYAYQRWDVMQEMMMTRQEIKDETKDREGDLQSKARMRSMLRNMMAKSGLKDVKTADVVITNPSHYAVALRYEQGKMDVPVVVARGADRLAEKIKEEARRHNIPRVENRPLARALFDGAKVGDPIPVHLYNAVAELLAYVYRIKNRRRS